MRVLIAVDHSEESRDAIAFARRVVRDDDHVFAVNVTRPQGVTGGMATLGQPGLVPPPDDLQLAIAEVAGERADEVVEDAAKALDGGEAEAMVVGGDPGARICQIAEQEGIDLIIVGTHDRGRFARLWYGSVSDYCVRHAPCPVLVVR